MSNEMTFEVWAREVNRLCTEKLGVDWQGLCGDEDPLRDAYDAGDMPVFFVMWWAEKYGLDLLEDIGVGTATPKRSNPEREALLAIGAQHPAWSANPDDNLVRIFNDVTKQARDAVGAKGATEEQKADWCSQELEGSQPPLKRYGVTSIRHLYLEVEANSKEEAVDRFMDLADPNEAETKRIEVCELTRDPSKPASWRNQTTFTADDIKGLNQREP